MPEKLTPRLVQEEIDRACALTGAKADDVIFGRNAGSKSKKTRKARRLAVGAIFQRTEASRARVSDAWGCEPEFLEQYWPTGNAISQLTPERFRELLMEASDKSGIPPETIISLKCIGTTSYVRLLFIERLIEQEFASYAQIADGFGVTADQIQGMLHRRGLSRDKIISAAIERRSKADVAAWNKMGN